MRVPDDAPNAATSHKLISGVVVTFDDDRHLDQCLSALSFCDELVVVDLGSQDESVSVAKSHGARIIRHRWVPVVEQVRGFAVAQARFEWIAFMDPDTVFPTDIVPEVRQAIARSDAEIIGVPYRNYFRGRPVRYGRWGGKAVYPALFHRDAVDFRPDVHRGFVERAGASWTVLRVRPGDEIVHHWAEDRADMDARAHRYAAFEGEARFRQGERFTWSRLIYEVPVAFLSSFVRHRGYRDGLRGVTLSFYAARLTGTFLLALRRVEIACTASPLQAGSDS